jgi:hypothetical protein
MSNEDGLPKLKYLGSYEGGIHNLIVPRAAFERVEQSFAAERAAEEKGRLAAIAAVARVQGTRRARMMKRFSKALRIFGRSR